MTQAIPVTNSFAETKRAEIRAHALSMGVDESYLSTLVETFYARVRADPRLGPIFDAEIGDHWGPHLARMKDFWASVTLSSGAYSGRPVPAHQKLTGVSRADFAIWLGLFHQTLLDTAPTPEAIPYLMERAERIAASLQMAMFDRGPRGIPSLG